MRRQTGSKTFVLDIVKKFFAIFLFSAVLVGTGYAGLSSVQAAASPSRIVAYQGRLLNSNGVPVSDASLPMIFTLYTALSGGTCVWSNNSSSCTSPAARTVSLTAGLFSENLGDAAAGYAAISSTVFSDNASIYLEIIVNGETLTPRKLMSASPYALNTDSLDGFDTTQAGATSAMVPVFNSNGNLTITGAPQGTGAAQGSVFINPATAGANNVLFGIAVGGAPRMTIDAEGDTSFTGVVGANDFSCTDCLDFTEMADTLVLDAATAINTNGFELSTTGNGPLNFSGSGQVTFGANVDATSGLDVTGANLSVGGSNFNVNPSNGNVITNGDLGVNGGDITAQVGLTVTTAAGGVTFNPASGLVNTATGTGLAVGAATLVAPFSVDASSQTIRFGSGATNDPTLNFYANDGVSTGAISFNSGDQFTMNGASFAQTGNGTIPSNSNGTVASFSTSNTLTGTSGSNLQSLKMFGALNGINYSAVEGSGTTAHEVNATQSSLNLSGASTTITTGSGLKGSIFNASTNNNLIETGGYLAGVIGLVTQNAGSTTTSTAMGLRGEIVAANGTLADAAGVVAIFTSGAGTVTRATGFAIQNNNVGTNRYGYYADVSGGTTNYSGYFTGSRVQIDSDVTPDATSLAVGAGDLYISNNLEGKGSFAYGSSSSATPTFNFSSAATAGIVAKFAIDKLQGGTGFTVSRANDAGSDFTGTLALFDQQDVSGTTTGTAVQINQLGTGNAVGLKIVQASTSAHSGTATGNNALVINVNEDGSTDDAVILRSDADNNGAGVNTTFRITTQGDTFMDGVMTSASVAVGGADYAEFFQTTDSSLNGSELVCQDAANTVKRCEAGNTNVMGVISTNPGVMGNVFVEDYRDILANPGYRLVGMLGQIDVSVTAADGAIAVGDPITTSSVTAGYGSKAHGPVRILGFALESLSSGTGTIRVMVQPQWYGGDVLTKSGSATQVAGSFAIASATAATASTAAVNSASLQLRGSAWDAGSAHDVSMSLQTSVNAINDYRLSVMNTSGTEVASVNGLGDLAISGKFYPSDRGASQSSKYIYYDGSSGSGGDFMRTNASGWGTGSYDFAEMFPSPDSLVAGEVVVFGDASQQVKRAGGETYSPKIAGIVSTRPGFLAGTNTPGSVPVALAGRVPTFVSSENGPINIGDPVTTSSHPGYAMKATEAGPIVGYAAEAFSGSTGSIVVYVNVSYYAGTPVDQGPATANTISHLAQDIENFDTAGVLNLNGGRLLAIGSMTSSSGAWHLSETGDLVTSGRLIQLVRGNDGNNVETYATTSRDMTVQLTGTINLDHGAANVHFADIDSSFTNIIDSNPSYRVLVTPYGATGTLYVTNRTVDGFSIAESGAASNGVSVDWMVIAYRRDYAPVTAPAVAPVVTPGVDPAVTPASDSVSDSTASNSDASEDVTVPTDEPVAPSDSVSAPDVTIETATPPDSGSDVSADAAPSSDNAVSSDSTTTSDSGSSAPESSPSSDSVAQ